MVPIPERLIISFEFIFRGEKSPATSMLVTIPVAIVSEIAVSKSNFEVLNPIRC